MLSVNKNVAQICTQLGLTPYTFKPPGNEFACNYCLSSKVHIKLYKAIKLKKIVVRQTINNTQNYCACFEKYCCVFCSKKLNKTKSNSYFLRTPD